MNRTLPATTPPGIAARRDGLQQLLRRAASLPHSGRSFLDHLVGTYRILVAWHQPPSLCAAGLLHSAYSTEDYPHALVALDCRHLVRTIVGSTAERLIHAFCSTDRETLWQVPYNRSRKGAGIRRVPTRQGGFLSLQAGEARALVLLECANLAEQSRAPDGGPAPWMGRVLLGWRGLLAAVGALSDCVTAVLAERSAIAAYGRALECSSRSTAAVYLENAISNNPLAAEPHLLRALCLDSAVEAAESARRGVSLLVAWGVPWDKRLPQHAWQSIARRAYAGRKASDYSAVIAALTGGPPPVWLNKGRSNRITVRFPEG